jgi:hypothetical protein
MRTDARLAMTRIEAVIVLLIITMLLAILLGTLAYHREQSRRSSCASNLKLIATGFFTYSSESLDVWPIPAPSSLANQKPAPVRYFDRTGRHGGPGAAGDPASRTLGDYWDELSTTRGLWVLVRLQGFSPGVFVCPSADDLPDHVANPALLWDFAARRGDTTADRGWEPNANNERCVSYGYQVPYGAKGNPSNDRDPSMPLVADKGPYGGVSLNNAQVTVPPPNLNPSSAPKQWRPFNSSNHAGKGQCVLFADSHAGFLTTPIVGVDHDNIYTAWKRQGDQGDGATRLHGDRPDKVAPYDSLTPAADTDSLIYP